MDKQTPSFKNKIKHRIKLIFQWLMIFLSYPLKSNKIKKLIFVIGYQRSGTNALFYSLSEDKTFKSFNESSNSLIMKNWTLRSERITRLSFRPNTNVLVKPISENYIRTTHDIYKEYWNYDLFMIFILRDPVNIYFSNLQHNNEYYSKDVKVFINDFNVRMEKTIEGWEFKTGIIVDYEKLTSNEEYFFNICKLMNVDGKYRFRKDSNSGYAKLDEKTINDIKIGTSEVSKALQQLQLKSQEFWKI